MPVEHVRVVFAAGWAGEGAVKDMWNRCMECGRFISFDDLADGKALHQMLEPDSDLGVEKYETLCKLHYHRVNHDHPPPMAPTRSR